MKNVIVTVVMLFGLITFAQEKDVQKGDRKAKMEKRESLSPEQQAELHVKKMSLELDLNANQQAEIKKMVLENAKKREAKKAEWQKNKEAGKTMTKDEKFTMKNQMLDQQIAHKAEMKKILTPEQFAKWEAKKSERKGKMHDRKGSKGKNQKERK